MFAWSLQGPFEIIVFLFCQAWFVGWLFLLHKEGARTLIFLPDTVRFIIAFIGGLFYPLGAFLVLLGMFFNDELMRRIYRQKGLMVVSGIDGSGKTTLIKHMKASSVYRHAEVVHYQKFILLGKASRKMGGSRVGFEPTTLRRRSILRAYLAFLDNLLLYLLYVFPAICKGKTVICDRWIWDTYIKHKSLGYHVKGLFYPSLLIKPETVIVLDIPEALSQERVRARIEETGRPHIIYSRDQLRTERKVYMRIAKIFAERYDTLTFPMIPFAQVSCS